MTDSHRQDPVSESTPQRRRSPLWLIGSLMWVLCLVALVFTWQQWRQKGVVAQGASSEADASDDDGRPQKSMKLVPQKDGTPVIKEVTKEEEANPWDPEGIEDFSFTDTSGQTLTKKDLLGKPFIVAFVFTNCRGPCPNVTLQMRELQDRLKDYDFNLVTLTVDPERDTIETLTTYGQVNGANFDRWKFLTGDQREIYGLIHRSFKMPVEEAKEEFRQPGFEIIHSTNIMLVDATGKVTGKYNAQKDDEMSKLRRDLKRISKSLKGEVAAMETSEDTETNQNSKTADTQVQKRQLPEWAAVLPAVNAGLNGLAGVLLLVGYALIKQQRRSAHAYAMIASFVTSIIFLGCYLVYHYALHEYTGEPGKRFGHSGTVLGTTYLAILVTHVVLAAAVPVLASMTLYRAWRQDWVRHRRIAVITFPIWVYVSGTGVIIYVMLYHWPGSAL
jgi:protein SCO1/2/putative membrane protein